ncbi:MAG: ABC transporter ATP-binding protein [Actinomycetaceae bacterium]|nr:ABC transporter ATP-binding protein [Actinomycetaceae bacterium]
MICVEHLDFSYGKTQVLNDLSFHIDSGETVALLGPNGAGKTTLVELMIGTLTPQRGMISVLGVPPRKAHDDFRGDLGLVLQVWSDHGKWQLKALIDWVRAHYEAMGIACKTTDDVLNSVGLYHRAHHKVSALSGGERRRADLGLAILHQPKLLILDEPTTGIDPVAKRDMHDLISELTDTGSTVLFTTHDMSEAEKLASRVLILHNGGIVANDSPDAIRSELASKAEIRWKDGHGRHVHTTEYAEQFVKTLNLDAISHLTIERPTLEDAYIRMIGGDATVTMSHAAATEDDPASSATTVDDSAFQVTTSASTASNPASTTTETELPAHTTPNPQPSSASSKEAHS